MDLDETKELPFPLPALCQPQTDKFPEKTQIFLLKTTKEVKPSELNALNTPGPSVEPGALTKLPTNPNPPNLL